LNIIKGILILDKRVQLKNNLMIMGKGDKKTKRGKITIGSYGARRRPSKNKKTIPTAVKEATPKSDKAPEPPVMPRKQLRTNNVR
jgi:30S ribosomal protein S31